MAVTFDEQYAVDALIAQKVRRGETRNAGTDDHDVSLFDVVRPFAASFTGFDQVPPTP